MTNWICEICSIKFKKHTFLVLHIFDQVVCDKCYDKSENKEFNEINLNDQLNHRKQRGYYYRYGLYYKWPYLLKMKYLDKLRRMIQKIKNKYPRWDIFKIVKEAQRRIK